MTKQPKKLETGRLCAVCGKRVSPWGMKLTEGFSRETLARFGIDNPAMLKAHPDCIRNLGRPVPPHGSGP